MRTIQTNSHHMANLNGTTRTVVRGVSLAHLKLTASQKAVLVADITDGVIDHEPTQGDLAKTIGVSVPMVQAAKRLSPMARQLVMSGKATIGYFARQVPKKLTHHENDDEVLVAIIKRRGVNHVIDVTAAVEAAE